MRHPIDPTVDCVFKAIFGDPANESLLLDLLNGLLEPELRVEALTLVDPHSLAEYPGDGTTIVDVKAIDQLGRNFQLEMQLLVHPSLPERMLYTWSAIYQQQLTSGDRFTQLRPVISVWILSGRPLDASPHWRRTYELRDRATQGRLTDHLRIEIVELNKWTAPPDGQLAGLERWVYFLKEAKNWDHSPEYPDDPLMRRAMDILDHISQKQVDYLRYLSRANALREQATLLELHDQAKETMQLAEQKLEQADQKLELADQKLEQAEQKIEQAEQKIEQAERKIEQAAQKAQQAELEAEQAAQKAQQAELETERLRARLRALGLEP